MSRLNKRRFHIIARLGNIPGFTKKTVNYLQNKKKNYFEVKMLKHKKRGQDQIPLLNQNIDINQIMPTRFNKLKKYLNYKKYEVEDIQCQTQTKIKKFQLQRKKSHLLKIKSKKEHSSSLKNKNKLNSLKLKNKLNKYKKHIKDSVFTYKYKWNKSNFEEEQIFNLRKGNSTYINFRNFSRYLYYFREKQRTKYYYGLKDYQLCTFSRKFVQTKTKDANPSGLIKMLKSRLDSVLFFFGMPVTMKSARQVINHRKVLVNGKIIDKPSYICKENDKIHYKMYGKERKSFIFSKEKALRKEAYQMKINEIALVDHYLKKF